MPCPAFYSLLSCPPLFALKFCLKDWRISGSAIFFPCLHQSIILPPSLYFKIFLALFHFFYLFYHNHSVSSISTMKYHKMPPTYPAASGSGPSYALCNNHHVTQLYGHAGKETLCMFGLLFFYACVLLVIHTRTLLNQVCVYVWLSVFCHTIQLREHGIPLAQSPSSNFGGSLWSFDVLRVCHKS